MTNVNSCKYLRICRFLKMQHCECDANGRVYYGIADEPGDRNFGNIHTPPARPISVSQHTDSRLTSRLNCTWSADHGVVH